jgi:hypothetical protein
MSVITRHSVNVGWLIVDCWLSICKKSFHFIHWTVLVSKCIANPSTINVWLHSFVILRTIVFLCRFICRLFGGVERFIVAFSMVVLDFWSSPPQMYDGCFLYIIMCDMDLQTSLLQIAIIVSPTRLPPYCRHGGWRSLIYNLDSRQ